MMENSVFSPNTCSWCLSASCNDGNCYPPDDPVFFTETNNIFCEEILPLVKNAKLELSIDSADPLIPYQFHFENSGWGQQWESNFGYEEKPWDNSSELWEKEAASSFWYDNDFSWNQTQRTQDWDWQGHTTSTWLDESLPNGSVDTKDEGDVLKEVLLEESSDANNIGLQIEEDDIEVGPDDDGGSSEDI